MAVIYIFIMQFNAWYFTSYSSAPLPTSEQPDKFIESLAGSYLTTTHCIHMRGVAAQEDEVGPSILMAVVFLCLSYDSMHDILTPTPLFPCQPQGSLINSQNHQQDHILLTHTVFIWEGGSTGGQGRSLHSHGRHFLFYHVIPCTVF